VRLFLTPTLLNDAEDILYRDYVRKIHAGNRQYHLSPISRFSS
jgi:hypothetical protein